MNRINLSDFLELHPPSNSGGVTMTPCIKLIAIAVIMAISNPVLGVN